MDLTARIAAALDALGASADPRQHIRERFGAPGEEILSTLDLLSRHAATLAGVPDREAWLAASLRGLGVEQLDVSGLEGSGLRSEGGPEQMSPVLSDVGSAMATQALATLTNLSTTATGHPTIVAFFDRALGDAMDVPVLATIAGTAWETLQEQGVEVPAAVVAAMADLAATSLKTAWKVSSGELTPGQAASAIADRAVAAMVTVAERAAAHGTEAAGVTVGAWLGHYVGNPQLGAQLGMAVGRLAGENIVRPLVRAAGEVLRTMVRENVGVAVDWLAQKARSLVAL